MLSRLPKPALLLVVFTVQGCTGTGDKGDGAADDTGGTAVDDLPPVLIWTSPDPGSVWAEGAELTLVVSIVDDVDADLSATLVSSLEGPLGETGSGEGLAWVPSVTGHHTVRATVEGSAGSVEVADLQLTVDGVPGPPVVVVSPDAPLTGDDLLCEVLEEGEDPEGGPVETTVSWLKDGSEAGVSGVTVAWSETARGQAWTCRAVSSDGVGESEPGTDEVVIGNTPPQAPTAWMSPLVVVAGEDRLTCRFEADAFDADGDELDHSLAWFLDGVAWTGATSTVEHEGDTIPLATLAAGQRWTCEVLSSDDIESGPVATARTTVTADPGPGPAGELDATSADAVVTGSVGGDYVGYATAFGGDLDGDGVPDAVIGAIGASLPGRVTAGAALVVPGPLVGELGADDAYQVTGTTASESVGQAVAGPGDLDGDGYDDLVVGASVSAVSGTPGGGAAYVVAGPIRGDLDLAFATAVLSSAATGANLGHSLAAVGDQTEDGLADFLVGGDVQAGGTAWLLAGPLSGSSDVSITATLAIEASGLGDGVADCLAGPGDVDGDGAPDLLVGGARSAWLFLGPVGTGAARMTVDDADLVVTGGVGIGCAVGAVGDLDGDGLPDLAIGAGDDEDASEREGAVYVLAAPGTGAVDLPASALATFVGAADGDRFGKALAGGDIDGDGASDLVIGAYRADIGEGSTGAAWIFHGPLHTGSSLIDAAARVAGPAGGDQLGVSLAVGGDVNLDGYADLLLGGYGADPSGSYSGAAWLFYGGP